MIDLFGQVRGIPFCRLHSRPLVLLDGRHLLCRICCGLKDV